MSPDRPAALVEAVHARLLEDPTTEVPLDALAAEVRRADPLLPARGVAEVARAVAARVQGLGPLDALLADPDVTEVMVNGPGPAWVERRGVVEETDVVLDAPEVHLLVERIVGPLGLRADPSCPLADARLADGSRVNIVMPPLAVDGPCLTIRRFAARDIPLAAQCPPGVHELLAWSVQARANLVVSGGTGSGKTTLLNAIGALLPDRERVVTVEDTAELRLPSTHVVRLEARPATADGLGAVTIRQLVRNALRMRPDRIVVGEVRGPEALDMLWAMNTGHEGSLTTCHANSPIDALRRLEVMVLTADADLPLAAVRDNLAAAVDLVVQVARLDDGRRGVVAVAEVLDPPVTDERVRLLADTSGLRDLPRRPPRRPGCAPPDPRWCLP